MEGSYDITVVYGSDQVRKVFNKEALKAEEIEQYVKTYSFKSKVELKAFILGLDEAQGWMELIYFEGARLIRETNMFLDRTF